MKILITGASSGMGYTTAMNLIKDNNTVYLCVHKEEELKSIENKNEKLIPIKLDITDENDLKKLDNLDYDIAFFNAAVGYGGTILEMDLNYLYESFNVNYFSTLNCVKKSYEYFLSHRKSGKIFVTSSMIGMMPIPYLGCYTSSKAALSSSIICMQKEIKKNNSNIEIILVEPGAFHTGFNQYMIDNMEKSVNKDSIYYKDFKEINRLERNFFALIESNNINMMSKKIIRQMYKKKSNSKVRYPLIQLFGIKLYMFLFR